VPGFCFSVSELLTTDRVCVCVCVMVQKLARWGE